MSRSRALLGPWGFVVGVWGACLVYSPVAAAEISPTVFSIEAWNASGAGSFEVEFADGVWDPNQLTFTWQLSGPPLEIRDPDTDALIARVIGAFLQVRDDSEIASNVSVEAGTSLTSFYVTSPLVSFPVVPAEFTLCRAVASVTVQDTQGGPGSFARAVGMGGDGTGIFRAYYNGLGSAGERFTHLVGFVYAGSGGTATGVQADPAVGYRPVGSDVMSLSTVSAFTLTAQDRCTTTTTMGFAAPEWCAGDVDGDGVVDLSDLAYLLSAYGTQEGEPSYLVDADFDRDGSVDLYDLSVLLGAFGHSCF